MNLKLILMTKDDKELIKLWLFYHGERLGYDNLHIVDDSTDEDIINFYDDYSHLNFHLYRDDIGRRNLNNMEQYFTKIQNSIQDDDPFFIKMDADEFLVHSGLNKFSIKKDLISKALKTYNKPFRVNPAQPKNINYLKKENSKLLDCTDFTLLKMPRFKSVFSRNQKINLGGHVGKANQNTVTAKDLVIIHFHHKKFEDQIQIAKRVCISHGYISEEDNDETIIKKLTANKSSSSHQKKDVVLKSLTNSQYKNIYFKDCEKLHPMEYEIDKVIKFEELKYWADSI